VEVSGGELVEVFSAVEEMAAWQEERAWEEEEIKGINKFAKPGFLLRVIDICP